MDEAIQEWNNSSKLKIFKSGSGNNRVKLLNDFSILMEDEDNEQNENNGHNGHNEDIDIDDVKT